MPVDIESFPSADGQALTIKINGRFDFSAHQMFRDAYDKPDTRMGAYVVDLTDTTYLDSSALGMLLLLRDYAGGDNANIHIKNCSEDVLKILSISNFGQLFKID